MPPKPKLLESAVSIFALSMRFLTLFALATALRIYFVNKLGERVVGDLRKAVYDHVLALDLAQVIKVRTGELISRMTTDMTIVERMISNGAPVALVMIQCRLRSCTVSAPSFTMVIVYKKNHSPWRGSE